MVESKFKTAAEIRLATQHFKSRLPDLWESVSDGQKFLTNSQQGALRGTLKRQVFKIDSETLPDGTLIQSSSNAKMSLRRMLTRKGRSADEIQIAVERMDRAPLRERVSVAEGYDIAVWPADSIEPVLDARVETEIPILKIAYEYLALHLGSTVFHHGLQPVRVSLASGMDLPDFCYVERLRGKEYRPSHGLAFDLSQQHAAVLIMLFGWLIYRVHFRCVQNRCAEFVAFTLPLESRRVEPRMQRRRS